MIDPNFASEEDWRNAAQKWANATWGAFILGGVIAAFGAPIIGAIPLLYGCWCIICSCSATKNAERCKKDNESFFDNSEDLSAVDEAVDDSPTQATGIEPQESSNQESDPSPKFSTKPVGMFLEFSSMNKDAGILVKDVSCLPYPKETLLEAFVELAQSYVDENDQDTLSIVKAIAPTLRFYQEGVGETPIPIPDPKSANLKDPEYSKLEPMIEKEKELIEQIFRKFT
ncbi:hypothetical protein OAF49_01375 [Akkermansiaceae bacterium]|nr:hypothetical protein [Akkermansiaceae bacterium]